MVRDPLPCRQLLLGREHPWPLRVNCGQIVSLEALRLLHYGLLSVVRRADPTTSAMPRRRRTTCMRYYVQPMPDSPSRVNCTPCAAKACKWPWSRGGANSSPRPLTPLVLQLRCRTNTCSPWNYLTPTRLRPASLLRLATCHVCSPPITSPEALLLCRIRRRRPKWRPGGHRQRS